MVKIGKILAFFLILGGFFIFTAASQTWTKEDLQKIYIEYLSQERYSPKVDETDERGDIIFKVEGDDYYILIDDNDLMFFQIYLGFKLEDISPEDALDAANNLNRNSKVVKVTFSSERKVVSITAELLLNDPKDFKPVFARAISLMRNAEKNFLAQIKSKIIS
jgi:hypothetical protein